MSLKVLGITGGVGSGKSTVLEYLRSTYGAYLIECDEVARKLQEPGETCYEPMIRLFGEGILLPDQTIDRKAAAAVVFRDPSMREKLNAIVHPAVKERVRELTARSSEYPLTVIEAALLLDDDYDEVCDEIWYVYADEDVRRRRLKAGRGYPDDRITAMFRSQRSDESSRSLTSCTIDNSLDDTAVTWRQIDRALKARGIEKAF